MKSKIAKLTRWAYFVVCHFVACKVDHEHVTATKAWPPTPELVPTPVMVSKLANYDKDQLPGG